MPFPLVRSIFLNRYVAFLVIAFLYIAFSPIIELTKGVWRMEIPLLLCLYGCLNFFTKPSRWQPLVAALPLAALYLGHDYYYLRFSRIPKWVEFHQLPELMGVLEPGLSLVLGAIVLVPVVLFVTCLRMPPLKSRKTALGVLLLLPIVLLLAAPVYHPKEFIQLFKRLTIEIIYYSNLINVEYNGRLATSLYNEAKRRETVQSLENFRNIESLSLRVPEALAQKSNGKNVHLIVMESFIDPTLLDKVPKTLQPAHPDYLKLVGNKQGFSVSPIFGGYTAQPEFEVLCGVPAFQEFDEIEFNMFTGSKTYCLPSILRSLGYVSTASNAYMPEFFNTVLAYKGIDFDAVYFAREYVPTRETYLSKGPEENNKFFFDEELFAQNLDFVKRSIEQKKPFFNYLLTVYGHFPFELDRAGPPLFTLPELPEAVGKIINQYHYRTKALAGYLNRLMALDPTALIIVVSDHLPPLPGGIGEYEKLGYFEGVADRLLINRLLVFRGGKMEKLDKFAHFHIYRLILDFVTDHAYCQNLPCTFDYPVDREAYRNDYHTIMGLASR
ncbi:MAG: sulfatase-like hydrolase/transferase [Magnetococcales bacterium]|nr:sulfatase-like hydrolase/transferase [Magnetococcales bacterium]